MASRGDIRDAFISELRAATTIDDGSISLRGARETETLPTIVYHDDYRALDYNGVGSAPAYVERDSNGATIAAHWREYMQAQFIIDIRDSDEIAKETHYEDLRTQFAQYQFPKYAHYKSVHQDIINISVEDATTADTLDTEDPIRGDQLEVRISFFREFTLTSGTDVENIAQINLEVDADLDSGTSGLNYTIT